jgi:eukaryotic-like serine/threonine-protein kinase
MPHREQTTVPATTDPSRELIFGLIALQNGMIDQDQLVAAFRAWTCDKARPITDHLPVLDDGDRAVVLALVERHLRTHGGDREKSLAALNANRSTRESLARVDDADIETSLTFLHAALPGAGEDDNRTATYGVGATTSLGERFRILRPHARGGLGAVFVALDAELNREVALKQILDHQADDSISRQRFLIEAEITGGLEHPGVVPIYGMGTYANSRPYYAMRFIRGDSLKEAIGRFHADRALERAADERAHADRALFWLRAAIASGLRKLALMQKDSDLDPLRSLPDFQLLMLDLAMPENALAK